MVLGLVLGSCAFRTKSNISLNVSNSRFDLTALNPQALDGRITEDSPYVYFAFSKEASAALNTFSSDGNGMSLSVSYSLSQDASASDTAFGFLYESDFASSRSLKKAKLPSRPMVNGTVSALSLGSSYFSLSMAFPSDPSSPVKGFFVYSSRPVQITSVSLEKPFLGWSFTEDVIQFGFPSSGGIIPSSLEKAQSQGLDFSQGKTLALNPEETFIRASFRNNTQDTGTLDKRNSVCLDFGQESYSILRSPAQKTATVYTSQLLSQSQKVVLTRNKEMVTGLIYTSSDSGKSGAALYQLKPLASDPGLIVLWDQSAWRTEDFELFSWELFPSVLILDFKNYAVQDEFLRRLAFFTEKKGYTGRLVTDEELEGQHGFNAHDYRPESLASFYALADAQNFPLNDKELLLRHILLEQGILALKGSKIVSGKGALLSISQETSLNLRYTLLGHECLHGIYFTNEPFRTHTSAVFAGADPGSLAFLLGYFSITPTLNYDIDDSYLIENEFMAYLLQQSLEQTSQYFINISNRGSVLKALPELGSYILETKAQGFVDSAAELELFIFNSYGLSAGRIPLVNRKRSL